MWFIRFREFNYWKSNWTYVSRPNLYVIKSNYVTYCKLTLFETKWMFSWTIQIATNVLSTASIKSTHWCNIFSKFVNITIVRTNANKEIILFLYFHRFLYNSQCWNLIIKRFWELSVRPRLIIIVEKHCFSKHERITGRRCDRWSIYQMIFNTDKQFAHDM